MRPQYIAVRRLQCPGPVRKKHHRHTGLSIYRLPSLAEVGIAARRLPYARSRLRMSFGSAKAAAKMSALK